MARPLNLNAYLYFETVARRGTVTRAAEELSVSPSAVSQQIKQLEQFLGVRLFRREGRKLSLTLEGEQLFQTSSTSLRMLRDAQSNLGRSREARRLNLRVTPSFGLYWLGPRLHGFLSDHPDLSLSVDAAPDPSDFEREVMDLDIRYGTGADDINWVGLHAMPAVYDVVLPLCAPAYLERLPRESAAETLGAAQLIDSARALCQWDAWLLRNGIATRGISKSILMDRSSMSLQLALDGAGIVLESLALAARDVACGRLVPVLPKVPVLRFPAYWVLCPSRHMKRRAVKQFLNWLDEQVVLHERDLMRIVTRHDLIIQNVTAATLSDAPDPIQPSDYL